MRNLLHECSTCRDLKYSPWVNKIVWAFRLQPKKNARTSLSLTREMQKCLHLHTRPICNHWLLRSHLEMFPLFSAGQVGGYYWLRKIRTNRFAQFACFCVSGQVWSCHHVFKNFLGMWILGPKTMATKISYKFRNAELIPYLGIIPLKNQSFLLLLY